MEADGRNCLEVGEYTVFPNGFSGLFFNFGSKGKLIINEEHITPSVSICGQIDRHFTAVHWPGFYSLGIIVKPTVLSRLLKVDMAEFVNTPFDGNLIRNDLHVLYSQLEHAQASAEKIELIETSLRKMLAGMSSANMIAEQALHILELPVHTPIAKLAKSMNVSERYLETQFRKTVGLSPKTYALIVRFKRIEQQLKKLSAVRWQDMEFAHEYHDQNHFIKDFKRFTGHTPSAYLLNHFEMGSTYLRV
jgi:AraC-like DNA-binding protein